MKKTVLASGILLMLMVTVGCSSPLPIPCLEIKICPAQFRLDSPPPALRMEKQNAPFPAQVVRHRSDTDLGG